MNEAMANSYQGRMSRVFDYINSHLHEDLSVERLSQVAHFSRHHFHRQFSAHSGISVCKFIQLLRLRRASYQLAFRTHHRIIDIAMAAGFENPESFSHAFKKMFGQTPSQFRKQPEWTSWQEKYQLLNRGARQRMQSGEHIMHVTVVDFSETKVAVLEHRGSPGLINASVQRFIEWRKENKLSPTVSATYNIVYDDPATVEPEAFRLDICAATNADVKENSYGVIAKVIPAGRCAVLRHIGPDDNIGHSIHYLYKQWLPESGEELRDFPLFFHRVNLFPDIPEHEAIIDIYLPLQ
jgi:AraC family transcriptional regulator